MCGGEGCVDAHEKLLYCLVCYTVVPRKYQKEHEERHLPTILFLGGTQQ